MSAEQKSREASIIIERPEETTKFALALPRSLMSDIKAFADSQGESTQRMINSFILMKLLVDETRTKQFAEGKSSVVKIQGEEIPVDLSRSRYIHEEQKWRVNHPLTLSQKTRIAKFTPNTTLYITEAVAFGMEAVRKVGSHGEFILGIPIDIGDEGHFIIY